jgi:hypothetical protein
MGQLGKLLFKPAVTSTKMFSKVLANLPGGLPQINPQVDWYSKVAMNNWGGLGNGSIAPPPPGGPPPAGPASVGDCTIAAADHLMMSWSAYAQGAPWNFDDGDAESDFAACGGVNATGLDPENILSHWKAKGLTRRIGGNPTPAKIKDYAALDVIEYAAYKQQVQLCIQLLGGCYLGLVLPKFCQTTLENGKHDWSIQGWTMTEDMIQHAQNNARADDGGHCVAGVGYDAKYIYVITWGVCTAMTWDFLIHYRDPAYAVLCPEACLNANGHSPYAANISALQAAFDALAAAGGHGGGQAMCI